MATVTARPKGASMEHLTQDDLDKISLKLNTRPRKTLDFGSPADRLEALLRRRVECTIMPPTGTSNPPTLHANPVTCDFKMKRVR
ncbi:hypothetical protein [Saccharothrix sp. ST-888]|uniref:hypothetical protein n=1 Tax=Saccharothrix sp. ST-888 TaxID=1427391 RepID=UPI0012E0687E|nr:hypothetical protein [Saccharothrix sp. ST-888]